MTHEEDRSNYQVCFDVADFSFCADRENISYGINSLILISRSVDERVDLHLSHAKVKENNIDEIERLAESFYKMGRKGGGVMTIETKYNMTNEYRIFLKEKEIERLFEVTPRAESIFKYVLARIRREIKQLKEEQQ